MIYKYTVICLMALIALFVIHLLIIKLNYAEVSARNTISRKVISDTSSFSSLYSISDKVTILTADNFNDSVYNSTSAWLVQFYNSWCGHCIKFSPVYKEFAADVYNWRDIVRISGIDCADDRNTQHCRDYEIMGYPTIRYFKPMTSNITIGEEFQRTRDDVTVLRHSTLSKLESTEKEAIPQNWPNLLPITDVRMIWNDTNNNVILLVVEKNDSFTGAELIMDMKDVFGVTVKRILDTDYKSESVSSLPMAMVQTRDKLLNQEPLPNNIGSSRKEFFASAREFLEKRNISVPDVFANNYADDVEQVTIKQSSKQKLLTNTVFQNDLNTALSYSLYHEISLKPTIKGEALTALTLYLHVLRKYFPFEEHTHSLVPNVADDVAGFEMLSGATFREILRRHGKTFFNTSRDYVGCKGSVKKYRGYPCGLWMMFHTLTVKAYQSASATDKSTIVLDAMAGYIKYFFGCQDCSEHFVEMSKTIAGNVTTLQDSVLWLWKAHNIVNKRLAGDGSEDPSFPKIQFPDRRSCSQCRNANGSWREEYVLPYLVNMYSNVKLVNGSQIERLIAKKENWSFLSDVNTCIALYVLSACLLTVYTVRFFMKRKPRGRHHKYEFSSKA